MGFERRTPAADHQLGSRRADVCARTCRRGYAQERARQRHLADRRRRGARRRALARGGRAREAGRPGADLAALAGRVGRGGGARADSHHRGFLVVDGLLSREVDVLGRRCVELIGPCDVLRPWTWDEEGSHVQAEVGWIVLEETTMAVLDHGLVERIMPWPALGVELFNRGTRRAHHLAVALAISHHQRVDDRLLLTLWHLAERWGRVTPGGHRRAAAARPPAARGPGGRAPAVGHERAGRADARGRDLAPRRRRVGAARRAARGSCATTSWRSSRPSPR